MIRPLQFRDGELPGIPRKQLDRLNQFFNDVRLALEPTTRTVDVAEYLAGSTIDVPCDLRAEHLVLTRALNVLGTVVSTAATALDWSWNEGRLKVRVVAGFTVGESYNLRFLVIGA